MAFNSNFFSRSSFVVFSTDVTLTFQHPCSIAVFFERCRMMQSAKQSKESRVAIQALCDCHLRQKKPCRSSHFCCVVGVCPFAHMVRTSCNACRGTLVDNDDMHHQVHMDLILFNRNTFTSRFLIARRGCPMITFRCSLNTREVL